MDIGAQSLSSGAYRAYREAQKPWLQAKVNKLQEKKLTQYNPRIIQESCELESPLPGGAAAKREAIKATKKASNFELFSTNQPTLASNIRLAPAAPNFTTAQRAPEKRKTSVPILPVVEDIDAPFLSPSLDATRSFRAYAYPWAKTAVYNEAMALRDQKFKFYNARPQEPVSPWEPHFLDHNTEAGKSGTFQPHTWTVEEKCFETQLFDERNYELNTATWVFGYVFMAAALYCGAGNVIFVSTFLLRESVAPVLLFSSFLLWLII